MSLSPSEWMEAGEEKRKSEEEEEDGMRKEE